MQIDLPYQFNFRDYQQPIWDAMVVNDIKRGITVWPRRNGKDLTAINILAAKSTQRVGLYLYMAPFANQVRQIIWMGADGSGKKFIDYIPHQLIKSKSETRMEITLHNGSVIKLCGSDNIDAIMGTNPVGIVFTEFSLHKPDAWHFLRPILAENGGWALFNGTPRGLNHFYQLFRAAEKNSLWLTQYLTRDDTGVPSLEAINEDRASGMPESLIQQEYYCSWTASSEEVMIPLDIVQPAINRKLNLEDFSFASKIIGVDPAYSAKGDSAVIAKRQGRMLYPLIKFKGISPSDLGSEVVKVAKLWGADGICVDSGRGEGVIDRISRLGMDDILYPVHFSGETYNDLYLNKRSEIYGRMKDWYLAGVQSGLGPSIPDDEKLIIGTTAPQHWLNDKGFIQMESKQQIRLRMPGTPFDEADAVATTFAEDIDPGIKITSGMRERGIDENVIRMMNKQKRNKNYNPMEYDYSSEEAPKRNDEYDPMSHLR